MEKNCPQISFFFSVEEGIPIKNYLRNPIKMVLMFYNDDFRRKLVVFVVKKVKKTVIIKNMYSLPHQSDGNIGRAVDLLLVLNNAK